MWRLVQQGCFVNYTKKVSIKISFSSKTPGKKFLKTLSNRSRKFCQRLSNALSFFCENELICSKNTERQLQLGAVDWGEGVKRQLLETAKTVNVGPGHPSAWIMTLLR